MLDTRLSPTAILASELIQEASITPNDANCQKLIATRLKKLDFTCEQMRFENVDNLWARRGTEAPLIVFAGHTDVVPTGPEAEWISPPFQPTVRDGILYGRGAVDMKGGIAAMITAVESFIATHANFKGSIAFLITSDEEGPALHGTQEVIRKLEGRQEKIDYCIIGEPSSDFQVGDQIRIGRRGSLHGKLIVRGKQGHVAHPQYAINPIHTCAPALQELVTTVWDNGNDAYPPTSFQISNIHGGTGASNVIPGTLEIVFNFRFSTAVTVEELKKRTSDILQRHQVRFDLEWSIGAEPFLTKRGKLISATREAIAEVTGLETRLSTGGGTSDGRFIAPTGAEVIELGPSNATAHHVNECVSLSDLDTLSTVYTHILEKLV